MQVKGIELIRPQCCSEEEDIPPAIDQRMETTGQMEKMEPPQNPSTQTVKAQELRDCPQTPVGRLPLSQLMGGHQDDPGNETEEPVHERVVWGASPAQVDITSSMPAAKRKRAVSISPVSSQTANAADIIKDPVDALWSKYSRDIEGKLPTGANALTFPLSNTSSPKTPANDLQSKENALRRAVSCVEWPTSAAKRRKLQSRVGQQESAAFQQARLSAQKAREARMSFLVDQVQKDLSIAQDRSQSECQTEKQHTPAQSKSASVMRQRSPSGSSTSLLEKKAPLSSQQNNAKSMASSGKPRQSAQQDPSHVSAMLTSIDQASSEFGDDDLEAEMLKSLDTFVHEDKEGPRTPPIMTKKSPRKSDSKDKSPQKVAPKLSMPVNVSQQWCDDDKENKEATRKTDENNALRDNAILNEAVDFLVSDFEEVFTEHDSSAVPIDEVKPLQNPAKLSAAEVIKTNLATESPTVKSTKTMSRSPRSRTKQEQTLIDSQSPKVQILSDDEEDFGSDSDFEHLTTDCASVSKAQLSSGTSQANHGSRPSVLRRYIVKSVTESRTGVQNGQVRHEKILSVQHETQMTNKVIVLRQAWLETNCAPGSYVHLVGDFDHRGHCVVDNAENLIVLHPDHLVSATVIGDSFTCIRRAVLQDRVKATSDASQASVYGHILHEIFQEALLVNRWDDEFLDSTVRSVAKKYLETLFEINVEFDVAVGHLKARLADLQRWSNAFISAKPKPDGLVRDRNGSQVLISINKLLEVEEHIWSPIYGLKGNIDATIQISMQEAGEMRNLVAPFELKTGRHANAAHKAQTALYSLLLSDRYDIDIACGILYYMSNSEILAIRSMRHELVAMIIQRNAIANYVKMRMELPPMLQNSHTCSGCYAQSSCFIYHKLAENGNETSSGIGEMFTERVRHLTRSDQEFFRKWDYLLSKEERDIVKIKRELWTMNSAAREKLGRCFGDLVIQHTLEVGSEDSSRMNRFRYIMSKQTPSVDFTFTTSQLVVGEPIVVSDELGHFNLASGFVTKVWRQRIEISVDRRLHNAREKGNSFDATSNQDFTGIMDINEDAALRVQHLSQSTKRQIFRLDKDEFSNGMALIRNNLVKLMEPDAFRVEGIRKLIIEDTAPSFDLIPSEQDRPGALKLPVGLNVDQKAAIDKVMSAKDYALVLGMPGTGKTTTIAHIIQALVAQGKSVLLTSYTHTAVDNILLKLREDNPGIFRIGAISKVHPEVQKFADLAGKPMDSTERIRECYGRQVVATTCLGINHALFKQRTFDYCIVDEASQITLPVCLGPICMAKTFILVGDHHQLPPLVQNKEAQQGGLEVSLFKSLSDRHPSSVVNLEHQYRMCEDIMTLSNELVYSGRLKCGTSAVAQRRLDIPKIAALAEHHHTSTSVLRTTSTTICASSVQGSCWLRDLLEPDVRVCFVDTDDLRPKSREILEHGHRLTNPYEAKLAAQLVEALLTVGVPCTEIGVITFYRSQLALLRQNLRHRPNLEMHTADKFQGRDKEVIILSLIRNNPQQIVGDLLKDWRRINVALTRARSKLLILGSKTTLEGNGLLWRLINLMQTRSWYYRLPYGAGNDHVFEEGRTQSSPPGSTNTHPKTPHKDPSASNSVMGNGRSDSLKKHDHPISAGLSKTLRPLNKIPPKQAKLDMNALLKRRPVLNDIINDAL